MINYILQSIEAIVQPCWLKRFPVDAIHVSGDARTNNNSEKLCEIVLHSYLH